MDIRRGFTLIELVIAMAISTMIAGALYFCLTTSLDSWSASQDQLLLQQASSQIMEELVEGLPDTFGFRDLLEITDGSSTQVSTVMPWTDSTHDVYSGISSYTLNKHIKPGTGLPIAEALLPELSEYKVIPITLIDKGKTDDYPRVKLGVAVPDGTKLRFTFFPDAKRDGGVITTFRYDEEAKAVFIDDKEGSYEIYKNPFGVKITDFRLRYFDNTNTEVGVDGSVSNSDIPVITGIEIAFRAESKNGNKRETVTFVSLRNAPMHSGNVTLREGTKFPIPNSSDIKAFFLTNLSGIENKDSLVLEAKPENGSAWVLKVYFSKTANLKPVISSYSIEYPQGNQVFFDKPRTPADLGLNLLSLGPNGLYDYGENGIEGEILLDGKVILEVKKMDIGGGAIFVKP